jgi:hypothetical protein
MAYISNVDVINADDLPLGASLYFLFASSMSIILAVMGLFSLISIGIFPSGMSIPPDAYDSFRLFKYALGNISGCFGDKKVNSDFTCSAVGNLLSAVEFVSVIVFFFGVLYLNYRFSVVSKKRNSSLVSASDYAVLVRNIPPSITTDDLVDHLNRLYRLDTVDVHGRPIVLNASPVESNDNHTTIKKSWIAECKLFPSQRQLILLLKERQHLFNKIMRMRAMMKVYSPISPHATLRNNPQLFAEAEKKMLQLTLSFEKVDEEVGKITRNDENGKDQIATVIFQYCESKARCINDYSSVFTRLPLGILYPSRLKLNGSKVKVSRIGNPDQVFWENIETPFYYRIVFHFPVLIVLFVLSLFCFYILVQTRISGHLHSPMIEDEHFSKLCLHTIPKFYGVDTTSTDVFQFNRDPGQDEKCDSGTFYAPYPGISTSASVCPATKECPSYGADQQCPCISVTSSACCITPPDHFSPTSRPTSQPSSNPTSQPSSRPTSQPSSKPTSKPISLTPRPSLSKPHSSKRISVRDPHFKTARRHRDPSHECTGFRAKEIGNCYCHAHVLERYRKGSYTPLLTGRATKAFREKLCSHVYYDYWKSYIFYSFLIYFTIFLIPFVNGIIRKVILFFSHYELFLSTKEMYISIALKVFFSNLFTLLVLPYLAFTDSRHSYNDLYILNGKLTSLSPEWYGVVGNIFISVFILQGLGPPFWNLTKYFVVLPLLNGYHLGLHK